MTLQTVLGRFIRAYRRAIYYASWPLYALRIFHPETGGQYGISLLQKVVLLYRLVRNYREISAGMRVGEQLLLISEVLTIPPEKDGCLVECGCYVGGTTATLTHAAELVDRDVHVFDSFEGMPEDSTPEDEHIVGQGDGALGGWTTDDYDAPRQELDANIEQYGVPERLTVHEGLFDETLPEFDEECALIYVDADYREGNEIVARELWPQLPPGCTFWTHGADLYPVASLFYDRGWWESELDTTPPGLVGAGGGLGCLPKGGRRGWGSSFGHAVKFDEER